ncbi:hypothetical protein DERP_000007 [Dermatophagoides pteronyssinus]|uniref:Uncharacterized protein n=1 Tax=Dermatophagoides pteronyssinus TaxID=6956 RepID=A0ABQ8IYX3_DERPT|nr:hypothetical protein DERP_000007 [Dermatophagoides pteronyssinus]
MKSQTIWRQFCNITNDIVMIMRISLFVNVIVVEIRYIRSIIVHVNTNTEENGNRNINDLNAFESSDSMEFDIHSHRHKILNE